MMAATSTFTILHGACALVYGLLAAMILLRPPLSRTGAWLVFACLMTALWAAACSVPLGQSVRPLVAWMEIGRSGAWFGFILYLYQRTVTARDRTGKTLIIPVLLAVLVVAGVPIIDAVGEVPAAGPRSIGLGFAVGNVLLLENLYFSTPPDTRWHINLLCIALGGLFLYDLALYADGVVAPRLSFVLAEGRAPATILAAPLIALAIVRNRRWAIDIHLSRDAAFHGLTVIGSSAFLLAIAGLGEMLRRGGSEWGSVAETSLIFGGLLAVAVVITSGSARSHLRSLVVDHFYSHRFDYRKEWMRCIDALSAPDAVAALPQRAIRAVADVVDSPAGALFLRASQDAAFEWMASWNMPAVSAPLPSGHPLITLLRDGDWIVALDQPGAATQWLGELLHAWLVVPLDHSGRLIGLVVLARPRAHFKLDREVFNLLRVIGREVASRVAEQRSTQMLHETQQLREYSQRFAFVFHDIKNVSGQLSMLLSNAELYADNPEFQRDMLATVRASVGKITRLLTRLQEQQGQQHAIVTPSRRLRELIDVRQKLSSVAVILNDTSAGAAAQIDPDAFDAIVTHLLNNATEAAVASGPVRVDLRDEAASVTIDITDPGPGMPAAFVRDELFRPFRTTKPGGHGIGAYQARELLRNAGGDLLVLSRPRAGTTMRIVLPAIPAEYAAAQA